MRQLRSYLAILLSVSVLVSFLPPAQVVSAQDLVSNEDVGGGSSVFVFRESRKKPQVKAASGRAGVAQAAGRAGGGPSAAQIAAAAKKRRADAAAARQKAAIAAANKKIAASNLLTAKAETSLDNGQTDLAVTNYKAALVENPKNTRASDGLSNALVAKGIDVAGDTNNEAAVPLFEEAIKYDAKNDVAYAKLGAIHEAKGRMDKATVNYEKAVTINPAFTVLYPPLGMAYVDQGDIAKAEDCLKKSDAAGLDTVETRYLRGVLLYKQNKNDEALGAFDKTLALDSNFAAAQYYRGQTLDRMGQPDKAVDAYKKTLQIDPSNSAASFDLGVAYYNKGDYADAATAYQQTIQNDKNNGQAHANLASTYRQLERYPEANVEYQAASATVKTPDLYSEWGYCLGKVSDWEKAVARLNTASQLSPSAIDNNNLGWAYYNAAYTQTTAKNDAVAKSNYALGKTYLEKAVQQDPKLDAAYLNLGSTHNALGEYQDAVKVLNVANSLHPNWVIAINQLGKGFRGLNDLVNAISTFKRAVDLDGKNTYGLFNLGESYFAHGDKKEAQKINDRLKKIDPALAGNLGNILSGKAVVDNAKQKVE
ncbi:MAG TPA: tetratricopeptide repeat protein, partial [Pyrinomonadaceae bacterium]|nr:tetratricopeptide repeat protein [Pyrinomonadaceae bacterium]